MVDNSLRCNPASLLDALYPHTPNVAHPGVTVMQLTPSLFMRWASHDIKHRICSPTSTLRILAFGGEPFPALGPMADWFEWHMPRLFNLYGLTEMSCWASVYEITRKDLAQQSDVPIGAPIDEHTTIDIDSQSDELLLKSKVRKCFQPQLSDAEVLDNGFEQIVRTGDIVERRDEAIYFKSRSNSIVKFYGQKLDLSKVEAIAKLKAGGQLVDPVCVFDIRQNSAHLFVRSVSSSYDDLKTELSILIHEKVNAYVKIHVVAEFPLTAHGKVDKSALLKLVRDHGPKPTESVDRLAIQLLNEIFGIDFGSEIESSPATSNKRAKTPFDASFTFLGGSSLQAIQIVDELERITSSTIPKLLPMLLNEHVSIREILASLSNRERIDGESKTISDTARIENAESTEIPEIAFRWSVDMAKCIDATPTICAVPHGESIVSVGSHSKLLFNMRTSSGELVSRLELPDRIECQVLQLETCGIVGCYDGHLYCFDLGTGAIKWSFDSNGMIKARAVTFGPLIVFGNYGNVHNLWCLNANDGSLSWCKRLGAKSIFANLIAFDERCFIASTLDGTIALIDAHTSEVQWSYSTQSPIFSTPIILGTGKLKFVIVAGVNGHILCLDTLGAVTWTHTINGNIFSSFASFTLNSNEERRCIVFGSQNHHLYCLEIDADLQGCKERWKSKSTASIRATPLYVEGGERQFVVSCSSDGIIQCIEGHSGKVLCQRKINGEIFSTPTISSTSLFVASRNNRLYCIDLSEFLQNKP